MHLTYFSGLMLNTMDFSGSNKSVWLIFFVLLCTVFIKEYNRITDNLIGLEKFSSWLPKPSTSTTVSTTTLPTTTAYPIFRKNLYMNLPTVSPTAYSSLQGPTKDVFCRQRQFSETQEAFSLLNSATYYEYSELRK